MHGTCPDLSLLSAFSDGACSSEEVEAVAGHIVACVECASVVAGWMCEVAEVEDVFFRSSESGHPAVMRFRRGAAAAALLLAGSAFAVWFGGTGWWARIDAVRHGTRVGSGWEVFRTGERVTMACGDRASFPDGSAILAKAGARVLLEEPRALERLRVLLEEGAAEFDVARAPGFVMVGTPLGEVRVLGTQFRVSLLRDPSAGIGMGRVELLEVLVREGVVELSSGAEATELREGQCGYVLSRGDRVRRDHAFIPTAARAAELRDIAGRSWRQGDAQGGLFALALLRRHGRLGVDALTEAVIDNGRSVDERVRHALALSVFEPGDLKDSIELIRDRLGELPDGIREALIRAQER